MFLGDGIFTAMHGKDSPDKGVLWSHSRKTASNIFNKDNFKSLMRDTFVHKSKLVVDFIENSEKGKPIDMQRLFFGFTMDSIMSIFFGQETNSTKGEANVYGDAYDEAHRRMVSLLWSSLSVVSVLDIMPFPIGPLKPNEVLGPASRLYLALHPDGRIFRKSMNTLKEFAYDVIKKK
eukprot:c7941_g1_i1.p1 GENE.c7941_g1_i1~~c7941_g1_i1.p1  ORF type:complete len:177 (+),score=50.59 c7941_g1_i1:37-567(+)